MTRTYIVALALFVALIAGIGTAPPLAQADVDGSVAIGCEFLIDAIDANSSDVADGADAAAACDGISSTGDNPLSADVESGGEAETLANALGNEDGVLTAADFALIDLDANQIREFPVAGIVSSIYVFAFVDDDGPVTFDGDAGLSGSFGPDELCDTFDEDADCASAVFGDGDGVVVATIAAASGADSGDQLDVTIIQEGDDDSTETINVTGAPNDVSLVLVETRIQRSDSNSDLTACKNDLGVMDTGALGNANSTIAIAVVTDNDDVVITRVAVLFDTSDDDIADIGDTTGVSVDGGTSGIAAFAVVCGGLELGEAEISATINLGTANEDISTQTVTVIGAPGLIALSASPAIVACDGVESSTVTATIADAEGNPVANGTSVNFTTVQNGTANPINTNTLDGVASSEITPLTHVAEGVTVLVTAGDAQASIRIDCEPDGDDPRFPLNAYPLPFSDFRSTAGMTHSPADPQPCGNVGADIWYRLTIEPSPPFNGTLVADTVGSNFNTVVGAYVHTGVGPPSVADSTLIDCDATGTNSSVTFDAAAGNTYFFQVGGGNGATGGLHFSVRCTLDADCDTVTAAADNCGNSPNVNQLNTDDAPIVIVGVGPADSTNANGDELGDVCDPDDDNDDLVDDDEVSGPPCATATGLTDPLRADTDTDRVLDGAECAMGTDPTNELSKPQRPMPGDSDRDGLSDALESSIGSNPGAADTDGDGINDGIEFRGYGTSIVALDSDGDGCADDTEITDVTGSRKTDIVDVFLVARSRDRTDRPNHDITKDGAINVVDLFLVAANQTDTLCAPQ